MLKKVLKIEGIGLLRDIGGKNTPSFKKITLLYAENGRGKSTFASLLNSCTKRNPVLVEDRVTIDADVSPAAELLFNNAKAQYSSASWSGFQPAIEIYDQNFVNDNVHTGSEVTASQRANLLDFALGPSAVQEKENEATATSKEQKASQDIKRLQKALETLVSGAMPIAQFRALPADLNIDEKIAKFEQKRTAMKRASDIQRQPLPEEHVLPDVDFDKVFAVLNESLESVHARAASRVSDHLAHLKDANSDTWIQQGLSLQNGELCPFCGQDTSQSELIEMYRIYFDRAYKDLQSSFRDMEAEALSKIGVTIVDRFVETRRRNNEVIQQWAELVPMNEIEGENDSLARVSLLNSSELLDRLFAQKSAAITEPQGSDDELLEVRRLWERGMGVYADENSVVRGYRESIEAYKRSLDEADLDDTEAELLRLRMIKLRHTGAARDLIDELKAAEASLTEAEVIKKDSRDKLNGIMAETLGKFKDAINEHLDAFNAEFQIAEFKHNYRGKSPKVEYRIQLRGKTIELSGGRPTFATALSEGDKKTMGFAFFVASALADPGLGKKVVVIDDPMSSLDAARREHTLEVIERLASKADQVIVMAHDEYFLRSVRERMKTGDRDPDIAQVHLKMASNRYSDLGALDLDDLCQSKYLADYKLVAGVVAGTISDPEGVAQGAVALRPLLEGYLHRKFPKTIPTGVTLGTAIETINDASGTDSPCAAMANRLDELRKLNNYAKKFHHNTQPDLDAAKKVTHQELSKNGEKFLAFIHSA
jgi:wobble nucleotide-excising tRNase